MDYQKKFQNEMLGHIIRLLEDKKAELEARGYIPTIELLIEELKDEVEVDPKLPPEPPTVEDREVVLEP